MIVAVFRSGVRPEHMDEYLARSMPGFISVKDWRIRQMGRDRLYEESTLHACDRPRESRFRRAP